MSQALSEEKKFQFWNKTRFFVLFLSLFCMTLAQVNSVTFNFTVICMEELIGEFRERNETHWMEDPTRKSLVFSGSAIGAIIGLFPTVYLVDRFGVRLVLTLCGVLSSLSSLLFPLAVATSFSAVILIRILEGVAASILITAIALIATVWAPLAETGTFFAVLSCVFQLSMIVCMPVSGVLCETQWGWRSIYYLFGALTIAFYALFFALYRNEPRNHPRVSESEAARIRLNKIPVAEKSEKVPVPWREICLDPTNLAAWISTIGADVNFLLLILYGPTYLRKVLDFNVLGAGLASALPYITEILVKLLCGRLSDTMTCLSVKLRFCTFAGISHALQAVSLLVMSFTTSTLVAQAAFTMAITACGINVMGNARCLQLRTRQYVHFSMGISTLIGCTVSFLTPVMVGIMCPDNTPEEWSRLFTIASIIVIVFYIPFPIFTSDLPGTYVFQKKQKTSTHLESTPKNCPI